MQIILFLFAVSFVLIPSGYAQEALGLSASVRNQIEAQVNEMRTAKVPVDAARQMVTMMHQSRFRHEMIVRSMHEVMNAARAGLPAEPLMNKAVEGMAKHVDAQQILTALKTVRNRYAHANRMAKSLSTDTKSIALMTRFIADSFTARMAERDMEKVAGELQVQFRKQKHNRSRAELEKLTLQVLSNVRTMARMGVSSSDISDTVCQALQNQHTGQAMEQLRTKMDRQVGNQHVGSIGKASRGGGGLGKGVGGPGGNDNDSNGSGSGGGSGSSDGGSGGSGGGSGGSGGGSGGSGGGSGGSDGGSGGSGGGSGGSDGGSGGNGGGSGGSGGGSGGNGGGGGR